jgi:hypothetical protein
MRQYPRNALLVSMLHDGMSDMWLPVVSLKNGVSETPAIDQASPALPGSGDRGAEDCAQANRYGPERVYRQHHFRGQQYGVQGVYCVALGRQPSVPLHIPRTKCLYLSEGSADRAVRIAIH